jgi:hypothetical protein
MLQINYRVLLRKRTVPYIPLMQIFIFYGAQKSNALQGMVKHNLSGFRADLKRQLREIF